MLAWIINKPKRQEGGACLFECLRRLLANHEPQSVLCHGGLDRQCPLSPSALSGRNPRAASIG
jgi:hypothetical protein